MESLVVGFKNTIASDVSMEDKSRGYKLVPWMTWDDWNFVRDSLFSSSPESVNAALRRVSGWRSRGGVPVVIEVTASIVEAQQKDPFFRDELIDNALQSEEMLTMLYCMTIMRLVNGVVEKTRKKNEVSIAEAADLIGIPRMLIDIRHECSHRDLPSLRLVRLASTKALEWLKSFYWEPQRVAIQNASDRTANLRKEIKSALRELAFSFKVKQTTQTGVKHCKPLCMRNKLLPLMAAKLQSSKPAGSKKQLTKVVKNFVRLYSSFSSVVVSVFLEFLLKAQESADSAELLRNSQVGYSSVLDDWKPVVMKLSNKEPEMLLALIKAVLQMLETREVGKGDIRGEHLTSEYSAEYHETQQLSYLFEWLVSNFKELKPHRRKISDAEMKGSPKEMNLPNTTLVDLLRKCLLVSSAGNNQLTASAIALARMSGNDSLVEKLNKLAGINISDVDLNNEEYPPIISLESFLSQQEDSIRQVAEKLESFKVNLTSRKKSKTRDGDKEKRSWVVAKSWNPCPIGMLPNALGSSGVHPVLECEVECEKVRELSDGKEKRESNQCLGKRGADCSLEVLDDSNVKKMKEIECNDDDKMQENECNDDENALLEGVQGQLMVNGVWKRVTEEELLAISSAVRILV